MAKIIPIFKADDETYLQGRTQTTQIGPRISGRIDTTCGVPLGSVLDTLLFLDITIFKNLQISSVSIFLLTIPISFMLIKISSRWN